MPAVNLQLRRARASDAAALGALMRALSPHVLGHASEEQAVAFQRETRAERMAEAISQGNRVFIVAVDDDGIAGFISVRDGQHIAHFFVAERLQGRGIGRRLWHEAQRTLRATQTTVFTVDASPSAAQVYEKLGFRVCGAATEHGGMVFIPMRCRAPRPDPRR